MTYEEAIEKMARGICAVYGTDPEAEVVYGRDDSRYPAWMDHQEEARAAARAIGLREMLMALDEISQQQRGSEQPHPAPYHSKSTA